MPRVAVEHVLSTRPEPRLRLIKVAARRLVDLELRLVVVAYSPVLERVAATLLPLSDEGTHAIVAKSARTSASRISCSQ